MIGLTDDDRGKVQKVVWTAFDYMICLAVGDIGNLKSIGQRIIVKNSKNRVNSRDFEYIK